MSQFDEKNLAQNLIILIAGLQDIGLYKEAESLSKKYNLFKEAQSSFVNVIDEESRKILDFAHPNGNLQITQSEYGQVHTDTSRQLKILENLNHAPTGKQVVAMVGEALGLKKKAQDSESDEEILSKSLVSQRFIKANNLINKFNELVPSYNSTLKTLQLEIPNLFKTSEAILSSEVLLPYYIEKSGISQDLIDNFNKKIKALGLDFYLEKEKSIANIINWILMYTSSNSKSAYKSLYSAIVSEFPQSAKEHFYGTNNNGTVDTGWLKSEQAGLLTQAQWVQKLNQYIAKEPLFYFKNENSIFNAKIILQDSKGLLEWVVPGSGGGFATFFADNPDEIAKLREKAYAAMVLDIELSLNSDKVALAAESIYNELATQRESIFSYRGKIIELLTNILSKLKSINNISSINSLNDTGTVLNELVSARTIDDVNLSIVSSPDLSIFGNYNAIFNSNSDNLASIGKSILDQIYELNPKIKTVLAVKQNVRAKVLNILKYWSEVFNTIDPNSDFYPRLMKYYDRIQGFNNIVYNSNSIEEISEKSKNLPGAFKISSEEDISKLMDLLDKDIAEHKSPKKEEVTEKKSSLKSNDLNKFSKISLGFVGEDPPGGGGEGGGGGSKKGPLLDSKKVEELQQLLIDSKFVEDTAPKGKSFKDGIFYKATLDAVQKALNNTLIKIPSNNKELQAIIDQLKGLSSNDNDISNWKVATVAQFNGGKVTIQDLQSLQSFEAMLVRNADNLKITKETNKGLTFEDWSKSLTEVSNSLNNINAKKQLKDFALKLHAKLANQYLNIVAALPYEYHDIKDKTLLSKNLSHKAESYGDSSTTGKNPSPQGRAPGKESAKGPWDQDESNDSEDTITKFFANIPFDKKRIYLKNVDALTGLNWSSGGQTQIPLTLLSMNPESAATSLFAAHSKPIPSYMAFLEGLKLAIGIAKQKYLIEAVDLNLPDENLEKISDYLDTHLDTYTKVINTALKRITNPIRRAY